MTCVDCACKTTESRARKLIKLPDGTIGWVCLKCWVAFRYADYFGWA